MISRAITAVNEANVSRTTSESYSGISLFMGVYEISIAICPAQLSKFEIIEIVEINISSASENSLYKNIYLLLFNLPRPKG